MALYGTREVADDPELADKSAADLQSMLSEVNQQMAEQSSLGRKLSNRWIQIKSALDKARDREAAHAEEAASNAETR